MSAKDLTVEQFQEVATNYFLAAKHFHKFAEVARRSKRNITLAKQIKQVGNLLYTMNSTVEAYFERTVENPIGNTPVYVQYQNLKKSLDAESVYYE